MIRLLIALCLIAATAQWAGEQGLLPFDFIDYFTHNILKGDKP